MPSTPTQKAAAERAGAKCSAHGHKHDRGNARDRAARKAKMIALHGNACVYCAAPIYGDDVEQDRVLGSCLYTLANVLPACKRCNNARNQNGATLRSVAQDHARYAAALRILLTVKCRSAFYPEIREAIETALLELES